MCMYMYVFVVYVCLHVCIFLNQMSFSPVYKAQGFDMVTFLHRREAAQSHFPVCPSFPFVIPQASSSNCVSHPLVLSFTALRSALSPTPSSHLLFPLNKCLIAPPPQLIFFFYFSQACLVLQHMLHNFPSCCFSFSFSDVFSLFFGSLLILSRTVICVCHPSVTHTDYNSPPKCGFYNK